MNEKDRKYAEKYRQKAWIRPHSAAWRKAADIEKFGFHVTDHAVVRYLERVLDTPVEKYRYERVVPSDVVSKVANCTENEDVRIDVKNYQLRVSEQTVKTVVVKEK